MIGRLNVGECLPLYYTLHAGRVCLSLYNYVIPPFFWAPKMSWGNYVLPTSLRSSPLSKFVQVKRHWCFLYHYILLPRSFHYFQYSMHWYRSKAGIALIVAYKIKDVAFRPIKRTCPIHNQYQKTPRLIYYVFVFFTIAVRDPFRSFE